MGLLYHLYLFMFVEYLTFLTFIPHTPSDEVKKLRPEILRFLFCPFFHAYSLFFTKTNASLSLYFLDLIQHYTISEVRIC